MTCIVGITNGKNVWVGGDSFSGNSEYCFTTKYSKITQRKIGNTKIVIGSSGTHRGGYLVSKMIFPDFTDIDEYINIHIPNAVRNAYKEAGYLTIDSNKEEHDCTFLFGINGRLFSMWYDFGIVEVAEDYWAIGSGMYLALGSLHTTAQLDIKPKMRIRMAIEAAAHHTPYVSLPIRVGKA